MEARCYLMKYLNYTTKDVTFMWDFYLNNYGQEKDAVYSEQNKA